MRRWPNDRRRPQDALARPEGGPSDSRVPTIGRVERLACGGLTFDDREAATSRGTLVLGGTNENPDYFHTNIDSVRGDLLRCQRYESSEEERSVWACEPW